MRTQFYVGQEVVAIKDAKDFKFKKGDTFIVKDWRRGNRIK